MKVVGRVSLTDAQMCKNNGWQVGDVLEGDEGYGPDRIVITAIGERNILARNLKVTGRETLWTLAHRDWKKVTLPNGDGKEGA